MQIVSINKICGVFSMKYEVSCGAVVFTQQDGKTKYVIIKSTEGYYGFPKGHIESGESEEETALREIREETGLNVNIINGFRIMDEHPLPNKPHVMKRVIYFQQNLIIKSLNIRRKNYSEHGRWSGTKKLWQSVKKCWVRSIRIQREPITTLLVYIPIRAIIRGRRSGI